MTQKTARILILSGARGDTRRYRTFHLHQQLRLAGLDAVLSHQADPRLPTLAAQADVLVLHRVLFDRRVGQVIDQVHSRGGMVLTDIDDLIFEPSAFQWIDSPDFADPVRASIYQQDMLRHRRTMQASDAIIASTDFLAGQAASLGKPVRVHRNAANLELMALSSQAYTEPHPAVGKVVIGYASGTPTHNRDFAQLTTPLQAALDAFPQAELRLIGHLETGPEWAAYSGRIQRCPAVPWRELPALLAGLDINLAPLVPDNPFSQSKSEIKYMEAALVQVTTLASRTDAFAYAIRPGENGLLAKSAEEWQAGLAALMMSPAVRAGMALAARQDALAHYNPHGRAAQAVELLNSLSQELGRPFHWEFQPGAVNERSLYWPQSLEDSPSLLRWGWYTLGQLGPAALAMRAWAYTRRALARVFPYGRRAA